MLLSSESASVVVSRSLRIGKGKLVVFMIVLLLLLLEVIPLLPMVLPVVSPLILIG